MTKITVITIATILSCSSIASAQVDLSLQLSSTYDDNSFSFFDKRADVYHQFFLSASKGFETDYTYFQLYYYGALVLFRTYDARTYNQHTLGGWYSIQLSHRESEEEEDTEMEEDSTDSGDEVGEEDSTDVIDVEVGEEEDSLDVNSEDGDDEDSTTFSLMRKEILNTPRFYAALKNTRDFLTPSIEKSCYPEALLLRSSKKYRRQQVFSPLPRNTNEHTDSILAASALPSDSLVTYLHIKPMMKARYDKSEYDFYDFQSGILNVLARQHLVGSLIARAQYEIEYKDYPQMQQFTNLEQNISTTFSAQLLPRTELFGALQFGYKSYPIANAETTLVIRGSGKGKGKGGVKPPTKLIAEFTTPATSQLLLSLGAIQKIGITSLSMSYVQRINPNNNARYISRSQTIGTSEDEVFDDRYGYEASELSIGITSNLFGKLGIESSFDLSARKYPRIASDELGVNLPNDPKREDARLMFQFKALYPMFRTAGGKNILSLGAEYHFIRNQSNDRYFDYHIHQGAVVLEFEI